MRYSPRRQAPMVALVMSDTHALRSIFRPGPIAINNLSGFFSYGIDFGGERPMKGL